MRPDVVFDRAPWHIAGQSEASRYITVKAASGRTVARIPWNRPETPLSECTDAGTARLIAAAPDMAETIRDLLALHIAHHNHPHHARAREILRAIEGA